MKTSPESWLRPLSFLCVAAIAVALLGYRPIFAEIVQCTTTCYVDAVNGSELNGGTSADDAKKTIQSALNQVDTAGSVFVLPGTYTQNITINKTLTLKSTGGREQTTIVGTPNGALGTVVVNNNTTGVVIDGFTIEGIDNPGAGIESAALYFKGSHSGAQIINNEIVANGDLGLLTEFNLVITGFVIDNNIFSGQTFIGTPAGQGFSQQFTLPNVPRQLVAINGNNASGIVFTNNQITGIAGGLNNSNQEQGNSLVTIDGEGSTITGNSFAGTTTYSGYSLRARKANTTISGNTFSSAGMGKSTGHIFTQNHPVDLGEIVAANTFDRGAYIEQPNGSIFTLINPAIAAATAGQTIIALPGLYEENIVLNKVVSLQGGGSGPSSTCVAGNPATDTIIRGTSGNLIDLSASGASGTPLRIEDIRLEVLGHGHTGLYVSANSSHVVLDHMRFFGPYGDYSKRQYGLQVLNTASIENWVIDNSSFNCLRMGILLDRTNAEGIATNNITIQNSEFNDNGEKGIYAEKLSNASILSNDFIGNGKNLHAAELSSINSAALDLNLKYDDYSNITIEGNTFTSNGLASKEGAALLIKARDDGSYASNPATLDSVTITGNTFTGNERGIRLGEPGQVNAGPTNISITNNEVLSNAPTYSGGTPGSSYGGIINLTGSQSIVVNHNNISGNKDRDDYSVGVVNVATVLVDARFNWWGNADGPSGEGPGTGDSVSVNVAFCPWLDNTFTTGQQTVGAGGKVTTSADGNSTLYCTIQAAIDASSDGDTVSVYPGEYNEVASNRTVSHLGATYQFGLYIDQDNLTIQGVDANGIAIVDPHLTLAKVKTNATNNFGYSGIWVQGDHVTIAGIAIQENMPSNAKTIEVIGNYFTLKDSHIDVARDPNGGVVYLNDERYAGGVSYIDSFTIVNNFFDHGSSVSINNGVGVTGDLANRLIQDNVFLIENSAGPVVSFTGTIPGIGWLLHPVGGAIITGNAFSGGGNYIRARGDYDNSEFDWTGIWESNTFDRAVVTLEGDYATPFAVRSYSYTSGATTYPNVRLLGALIQPQISDIAAAGDTVLVAPGTYNESPNINKSLTLRSSGGRDVTNIVLQTGPTYVGALTIGGAEVTIDGFTLIGRDAIGTGLASTNILVGLTADNVTIQNNRLKVGQVGTGSNGDDGLGILTSYATASDVETLLVANNVFEPLNASGRRAFFINPGVNQFTFTGNSITGNFAAASYTQAQNGLVENNSVTGEGAPGSRSGGLGVWGYPDPTIYGHTTFRGNTISGTATGINIVETESVLVEKNVLTGNDHGVKIAPDSLPFDIATIHINRNDLSGNSATGLSNGDTRLIDSTCNWWGNITGPAHASNSSGTGSVTSDATAFSPWLTTNDLDGTCELGSIAVTVAVVGSASYGPTQWDFTGDLDAFNIATAGSTQSFPGLQPGSYTINQAVDADYDVTVDCGSGAQAASSGTINLAMGQHASCTFTNTLKPATLTVTTLVINDHGGSKVIADFPLFVNGSPVTSGVAATFAPGTYTVSESGLSGYSATVGGDCAANGVITLEPGAVKSCTITNDDLVQGTVSVTKLVVGSSVFAPANGWQFNLGDISITLPAAGGTQLFTNVAPGSYTLSEVVDPDYTTTVNCGAETAASNSANITVVQGQTINCTFTNTLKDATLTVTKTVVNDNGGTATVADFPLFVNGSPVTSGEANTFAPGTYTVSESNLGNYAPTFSGDCAANGVITLAPGENKSCTITNNDIAASEKVAAIGLVKTVGVVNGVCATDTAITVLPGETVYYCYTITNNGNVTLTQHTLVDSELGTIIDGLSSNLTPGQTVTTVALGVEASGQIDADTTNTATWTALATDEALIATASAVATVTLGIEDYLVTVEGTYLPPAEGGTTGGEMIYDINVLNTGTAILKNLQLAFVVPAGTAFAAGDDNWSCADGAPAGSICTITIDLLEPGEDVDIQLNLDIIAEININQLVLELSAVTEGTPTSPTSSKDVVVVGPNAATRVFIFLPALDRAEE